MPSALPTTEPTVRPVSTTRRDRVLPLDGLRTLAIALVVLYHLHVPGFGSGFVGVNVFFVLSGYLITTLLLREHASTGRIRLGRFWVRRLLRLYPTLLAVVVVGVSLWWLVGDYQGSTLGPVGAALIALTYTGNVARAFFDTSQGVFAPMWSLSMEEQFYLVWPPVLVLLLAVAVRRKALVAGLSVVVVASAVATWFLYDRPSGGATPDIYFSPVLNVAPLLMGCVLAVVLRSDRVRTALAGRWGALATWLGFAGVVGSLFVIGSGWQQSVLTFAVALPAVGLASMLLIGGLVTASSPVAWVLSLAPVAWFGRAVSYPLYLWHVVFIALVEPYVQGALGIVLVLAAAICTSVLSHHFVEKPALALKGRFEPREPRRASSTVSRDRELTNA
ncbi:acyltransferase [Frigoribacterium sp. CFBP 13605]|uniref:acyltransferase family protein n=1 Tax=Frigoribacterium sp. CFBP 13605 TaxID=2774034 RepID=UPI001908800D|nr:acyltransferase [Frigoribacterium sp. CFBP 13605]MBD8140563.1 acyltransferase [Frigoribacterium sp. CFBP 13605]